MPLVRVVIPSFNRASLLREALDSVLAQPFQDYEVVVADDGSTDETKNVLEDMAGRDSRIRWLTLPHGGSARARNRAVEASGQYKYLAFLDSDDLWMPHHLGACVRVLENEPAVGVVFGGIEALDVTDKWTEAELRAREERMRKPVQHTTTERGEGLYILDGKACWKGMVRSEFTPAVPTVVLRQDVVGRTPWFDERLEVFEDCELFLYLARSGVAFGFLDEVHARIRHTGDNLTGVRRDLSSPVLLRRYRSILRYAQMKLQMCSEPNDRVVAQGEVADMAYLVAQCYAEQGDLRSARRYYLEGLRHRASVVALKGLLASLLPAPIYYSVRRVRDGLLWR